MIPVPSKGLVSDQPLSVWDKLRMALGNPETGAYLRGMGQQLLAASGPSRTPVSFTQAMSAGMAGGNQSLKGYRDEQRQKKADVWDEVKNTLEVAKYQQGADEQARKEAYIASLPPEQQALARMNLDEFTKAQTEHLFSGQEPPKASDIAGMRKEFIAQAKPFIEVRDAYRRVQVAQPNAAGDQALIFGYMKMLDPGSTVREGEFATARNAAGVPERMRTLWNNVLRGEILSPDQRMQFKGQAAAIYQQQEESYGLLRDRYTGLAKRRGYSPEDVVPDFRMPHPATEPQGGSVTRETVGGEARDVVELDGKKYIRTGPGQFMSYEGP